MVRGVFDRELWGAMGDGAVALPVCSLAHALPELLAISLNDFLSLRPPPNKVPCAVGLFVRAVHGAPPVGTRFCFICFSQTY